MEHKSNIELAVEATIEYVKSWNAKEHNQSVKPDQFIETLKDVYSTICSLTKD